jgi:hypothetical protein
LSVHVLGELQTTFEYVSSDIVEWTMFGEGMGPQAGESVLPVADDRIASPGDQS